MCGIVGYIGKANAASVLISGLKRLEYRGYDSAGLALLDGDGKCIRVAKSSGKVANLSERARMNWSPELFQSFATGIAHTRWATHGPPTEVNAHPHLDETGDIALVHNGIIENYRALRARLEGKGHHFISETDTEVLSHLIGDCDKGDLFQAVCDALHQVEGTFGIAVISSREPGKVITARRGSPIVIGVGDGETIIASDASAIVAHTQRVIYLDDNDIAIVTVDGVDIRDLNNVPVTREIAELGLDCGAAEKGGFEHFMIKEIHEQPDALANAIRGRLDMQLGSSVLAGMGTSQRDLAELSRVVMVGCGTSLHAAMVGEYAFEDLADIHAEVQQAAEFRYRNPILGNRDFVIAISQSGETADTLAAVKEAQQKGAFVMSLVNVVGSTIARETGRRRLSSRRAGNFRGVHQGVHLPGERASHDGAEARTGSSLLPRGRDENRPRDRIHSETRPPRDREKRSDRGNRGAIPGGGARVLHRSRPMYPVALEGALKLKEISYIHAEGYHAAELKHGPIALLQPGVPVIAVACEGPAKDKTLGNVEECRARGSQDTRHRHRGRYRRGASHGRFHLHPESASSRRHRSGRCRSPDLFLPCGQTPRM